MAGLVVGDKADRVQEFQAKTVTTAFELIGALGLESPSAVRPCHFLQRISPTRGLGLFGPRAHPPHIDSGVSGRIVSVKNVAVKSGLFLFLLHKLPKYFEDFPNISPAAKFC